MPLTGENQFAVTLSVDGTPVQDVFDSWDGGDVEADNEPYNAGGMAAPEPYVSTPTTSAIEISRAFRGERDAAIRKWLTARIGREGVAAKQALNPDRTPVPGGLETYRVLLVGVTTARHDSMGRSVTRFVVRLAPIGLPS